MDSALDRSKWRSVISPKVTIFFLGLTSFDVGKYWPKLTKIAHHKIHWRAFPLTKFRDSSSYRSWDSREGQNLHCLSRARDSQTVSSARVKGTNPSLKKSLNIPEIYAKMFGRFHWLRL